MPPDSPALFAGRRLVIFGAGYVGVALAGRALALGLRVTALTRNPERAAALAAMGAEPVVAELDSADWHARIAGGADYAVDCVSSAGGGVAGYRKSYLEGMRSILAWAKAAPVGTLVYTGSTSVYPQDGGVTVDETATTGGGENAQVLLETEVLARAAVGTACERVFVLRLAGIYGPGRHHLLDQLRMGGPVAGRSECRLNLVHRDDVVAGILAALAAPAEVAGGVFNLADERAATRAELVGWLAGRLGLPAPAFTGEAASGRRPHTPDRVISGELARRVLGWRPRYPTFREGYAALLEA